MKRCFKCHKEKPLSEFYKHKAMSDGHLNKCIDCTKEDARENRRKNGEKIRKYDRERAKTPKRKELASRQQKKYRAKNRVKDRAHNKLHRAVKMGFVFKKPCAVCGAKRNLEAHHFDYSKPLEVIWLCSLHHSAVHYPKIPWFTKNE